MRILVTGARGMLGQDVVAVLTAQGHAVDAAGREELDVLDPTAVAAAVPGHDAVVNCAAWTAVDDAEAEEAGAFALNALAPAHLAAAAASSGARLVHVSTDYVFDGSATAPYPEDGPLRPRSAYGRTKAAGEWAVRASGCDALVLRTAWLYGAGGACFPRTIARLAHERGAVGVVDDQVGQPTWTRDVAVVAGELLAVGAPAGTYHATAAEQVSWYGFARSVVASAGLDADAVSATTSAAFVRPAPRPAYSALASAALTGAGVAPIGPWHQRWAEAAPSVLP